MKNQKCRIRPKIINDDLYYPFSMKINKRSGNCFSINDPYFKLILNTKQIKVRKNCTCECKSNSCVCNNK